MTEKSILNNLSVVFSLAVRMFYFDFLMIAFQ
jgi:hypothetical protein